MSTSPADATLEAVLRAWITEAEVAIYSAKKRGACSYNPATSFCGALTDVPKNISLQELELEVIPEIKHKLGF